MIFFPNEKIISQPPKTNIVLTNHRIWQKNEQSHKSIMLEHITSCETKAVSYPILLIIGIIVCIQPIFMFFVTLSSVPIIDVVKGVFTVKGCFNFWGVEAIGIGLIVFYRKSKNTLITIKSPSIVMKLKMYGKSYSECLRFVDEIEQAKNGRTNKIG